MSKPSIYDDPSCQKDLFIVVKLLAGCISHFQVTKTWGKPSLLRKLVVNEACGSSQIDLTYEIEPKIIQKEIELECEQKRASSVESKA